MMRGLLSMVFVILMTLPVYGRESGWLRPAGMAERCGYIEGDTLVTVPGAVTSIPDYCFAGIDGLKRIVFPPDSKCTRIGEYAFAECLDLEDIILPEGLLSLGEGAFRECRSIRRLEVPARVTSLPKEMCLRCVSLESIRLPRGLVKVGSFALAGCESLAEVDLPAGLKEIGSNAFTGDVSLKEIVIPAGVRSLESYAFAGCRELRRIVFPARRDMIGELMLSDCPVLEEIEARSPVPPEIDCLSFILEPDDTEGYERVRVKVPRGSAEAYRKAHGWGLFRKIGE